MRSKETSAEMESASASSTTSAVVATPKQRISKQKQNFTGSFNSTKDFFLNMKSYKGKTIRSLLYYSDYEIPWFESRNLA